MAITLRGSGGWFSRTSLLFDQDSLIILEQASFNDRLRRILYDRVESLVIWKRIPWLYLVLSLLLFAPGVLIILYGPNHVAKGIGAGIVISWLALVARLLYCRLTTIRITRASKVREIKVLQSPRKVDRFSARLRSEIEETQQRKALEAESRQTSDEEEDRPVPLGTDEAIPIPEPEPESDREPPFSPPENPA